MARALKILVVTLGVLLVGAVAIGEWKDPEDRVLDESARTGAPGRFVTLSQGVTRYDVAGPDSGRTVVLVHGFSVPYYIWDSTSVALSAAGYRVIRYDVFGRGFSDRPDAAYDSTMFVAQLGELLDSLRVSGPVDLAGLSFGGFIAAHFVAAHPERVRTLVLVDPASDARALPSVFRVPFVGPRLFQAVAVPGMADGQLSDFLHPERYPTWVEQYRPQMQYKGFGRALLRSANSASTTDYPALFGTVGRTGVPVLLIWGKQDQTIAESRSSVARDAIPGLEYLPVDSAGHLPHIEQSALVHERMRAFFDAHPPRPAP